MRHLAPIIIKLVMVTVVLVVMFNMFNNYPFGTTFLLALLTTGIAYLVGDLFILPRTSNTVATLADIGLATLTLWWIGSWLYGVAVPFSLALLTGIVLGVGEWFFHKFMERSVFKGDLEAR